MCQQFCSFNHVVEVSAVLQFQPCIWGISSSAVSNMSSMCQQFYIHICSQKYPILAHMNPNTYQNPVRIFTSFALGATVAFNFIYAILTSWTMQIQAPNLQRAAGPCWPELIIFISLLFHTTGYVFMRCVKGIFVCSLWHLVHISFVLCPFRHIKWSYILDQPKRMCNACHLSLGHFVFVFVFSWCMTLNKNNIVDGRFIDSWSCIL